MDYAKMGLCHIIRRGGKRPSSGLMVILVPFVLVECKSIMDCMGKEGSKWSVKTIAGSLAWDRIGVIWSER
jgi:hypothetical protein